MDLANTQGLQLLRADGDFTHFSELTLPDLQDGKTQGLTAWANTTTYVVDANRTPLPVGVPGEIAIGGMGVAAELDADAPIRDV